MKNIINYQNLFIVKEVKLSMLFMILWWIILIVLVILVIINHISKDRGTKRGLDYIIGLLAVLQLIFIIVTIGLRDPIFELIGLPKEYEWIGGLLLGGFITWQFYLNPLKNRVIEVEKDTREIRTDVRNIKEDTTLIKGFLNKI